MLNTLPGPLPGDYSSPLLVSSSLSSPTYTFTPISSSQYDFFDTPNRSQTKTVQEAHPHLPRLPAENYSTPVGVHVVRLTDTEPAINLNRHGKQMLSKKARQKLVRRLSCGHSGECSSDGSETEGEYCSCASNWHKQQKENNPKRGRQGEQGRAPALPTAKEKRERARIEAAKTLLTTQLARKGLFAVKILRIIEGNPSLAPSPPTTASEEALYRDLSSRTERRIENLLREPDENEIVSVNVNAKVKGRVSRFQSFFAQQALRKQEELMDRLEPAHTLIHTHPSNAHGGLMIRNVPKAEDRAAQYLYKAISSSQHALVDTEGTYTANLCNIYSGGSIRGIHGFPVPRGKEWHRRLNKSDFATAAAVGLRGLRSERGGMRTRMEIRFNEAGWPVFA